MISQTKFSLSFFAWQYLPDLQDYARETILRKGDYYGKQSEHGKPARDGK